MSEPVQVGTSADVADVEFGFTAAELTVSAWDLGLGSFPGIPTGMAPSILSGTEEAQIVRNGLVARAVLPLVQSEPPVVLGLAGLVLKAVVEAPLIVTLATVTSERTTYRRWYVQTEGVIEQRCADASSQIFGLRTMVPASLLRRIIDLGGLAEGSTPDLPSTRCDPASVFWSIVANSECSEDPSSRSESSWMRSFMEDVHAPVAPADIAEWSSAVALTARTAAQPENAGHRLAWLTDVRGTHWLAPDSTGSGDRALAAAGGDALLDAAAGLFAAIRAEGNALTGESSDDTAEAAVE